MYDTLVYRVFPSFILFNITIFLRNCSNVLVPRILQRTVAIATAYVWSGKSDRVSEDFKYKINKHVFD